MKHRINLKLYHIAITMLFVLIAAFTAAIISARSDCALASEKDFSGGNGTAQDPFLLSTQEDFVALMDAVNAHTAPDGYFNVSFELTGNIDLSGIRIEAIGSYGYPFKGILNGNGYEIQNVRIAAFDSREDNIGLFGVIGENARVENLTVTGSITGKSNVGGLVGTNSGQVINCVNYAFVSSISDVSVTNVGGVCGYNVGEIRGCVNYGKVLCSGTNVGGIAGINYAEAESSGSISNCYNAGAVESQFYGAGGIVGHNQSKIGACFNAANISAYSTVGGIAGSNSGTVVNAYNTALITAEYNIAGGICGSSNGAIYHCVQVSGITAVSLQGAICGFIQDGAIENCYFSSDRYAGNMTNKGSNYPFSKALSDADMTSADALTHSEKMFFLTQGRGAGNWGKRNYDTFCYYPELTIFKDSDRTAVTAASRESVKTDRIAPDSNALALDTTTYIYDGSAKTPGVMLGKKTLILDSDYSVIFYNNTNAGNASAEITLLNSYKGTYTKTFLIEKCVISVRWPVVDFYYNGSVQYPTVTTNDESLDNAIEFTYDYTGGIDAGTHSVRAKLAATPVNKNYSFAGAETTYVIQKKPLLLRWDESPMVYNGRAQFPIATVISDTYGEEIELVYEGYEKNIRADVHTVYARLSAAAVNQNYSLETQPHRYEIQKKEITVTFDSGTYVYNGKPQYPTARVTEGAIVGDDITLAYQGISNNVDAGKNYCVFVILAQTEVNRNYTFIGANITYAILKRPITITFDDNTLRYNRRPQYPSFQVLNEIEGERILFNISDYSNHINAGRYKVIISLKDVATNANYDFVSVTESYVIEKAVPDLKLQSKTFAYDGRRKSLQISGYLPEDITILYENNEQTAIGAYPVTAKFIYEAANYEPLPDLTAFLYITQASFQDHEQNVIVDMQEEGLVYGTVCMIEKSNYLDQYQKKNAETVGGYLVSFLREGQIVFPKTLLNITVRLDRTAYEKKNLSVYVLTDDRYEKIEYERIDDKLIFSVKNLKEFFIVEELNVNADWFIWGIGGIMVGTIFYLLMRCYLFSQHKPLSITIGSEGARSHTNGHRDRKDPKNRVKKRRHVKR